MERERKRINPETIHNNNKKKIEQNLQISRRRGGTKRKRKGSKNENKGR